MVELMPGMVVPGVGSGTNIGVRGLIEQLLENTTASVQTHINGMQINGSILQL